VADKVVDIPPSKTGTYRGSSRAILAPKASLTCQSCGKIEAMIRDGLDQNKTEIILDFKSIPVIDSEGLELLLRMQGAVKDRGGSLKLIGLNAVCWDILKATKLIKVFRVYKNIHKAIKDVL
jgi:anti-anti-sigma factor